MSLYTLLTKATLRRPLEPKQYATVDVTVPVVIPVLWAGNTPIYFGKGVVVLDQAHQVP